MKLADLIQTSRALGQTLRGMAELGVDNRLVYDEVLRAALTRSSEIYGTWTVWEPGALDGCDSRFRNYPGHDATGRYLPSWYRNRGKLCVEPNTNYDDQDGLGDYYQIPHRTRSERTVRFSEYIPLSGEQKFFTCHIVPLMRSDRFLGVAGVDVLPETIEDEPCRQASPFYGLSARQREVLHWIAAGKTNVEIAIILGVSPHTIKNHVSAIFEKLGVENRRAAMLIHLTDPDSHDAHE